MSGTALVSWTISSDLYSWWKAKTVLACGLAALVALHFGRRNVGANRGPFLLLGTYVALVWIASLSTPFRDIALHGFANQYEGALVITAYVALALSAATTITDRSAARAVVNTVFASGSVIAAVGVSQSLGVNPLSHWPFQSILGPDAAAQSIALTIDQGAKIASTLYNPNYAGSYVALTLPLIIAVYATTGRRLAVWPLGVAATMIFALGVVSGSRGGLAGSVAGAFLGLVLLGLAAWRARGRLGLLMLAFAGVVAWRSVQPRAIKESFAAAESFESVEVDAGLAFLKIGGKTLLFRQQGEGIDVRGPGGVPIPLKAEGSEFAIISEEFKHVSLSLQTLPGGLRLVVVRAGSQELPLALTERGLKVFAWNALHDTEAPPTALPRSVDPWLSGRGFIWSRTLPIVSENFFLGVGPGAFALHFPHRDFGGKMATWGTARGIIDKPHNLYLQVATGSGVPSLACLLGVFAIFFRNAWRRRADPLLVGLVAGVFGYLVTSLINDSVVSVAPVFWVLLGTGFGLMTSPVSRSDPSSLGSLS